MAKSIVFKIDEERFRDIHIRAAKRGLSIQKYVTGLIERDLFPERCSRQLADLSAEELEQIQSAAHRVNASVRQVVDTLDEICHLDAQAEQTMM